MKKYTFTANEIAYLYELSILSEISFIKIIYNDITADELVVLDEYMDKLNKKNEDFNKNALKETINTSDRIHQKDNNGNYIITGKILKTVFQNSRIEYCIYLLEDDNKNKITICRNIIYGLSMGDQVKIIGSWFFHKKYGIQFKVINSFLTKKMVYDKKNLI